MTTSTDHESASTPIAELIAIGRDREAVAAATQRATEPTTPGADGIDGVQQLDEIIPLLDGLVAAITDEQLDDPTPCAGFTVASVLEHMIAGATAFAPAFRGEPAPAETTPAPSPVRDRWRAAMRDLSDAVHSAGAQARTITTPFGVLPGSAFARYVAFDGLVHGWDLAVATGRPYTPPAEVVAEADTFARGFLADAMRDGDTFAAEIEAPPDAGRLARLVAFTGRSPFTKEHQR